MKKDLKIGAGIASAVAMMLGGSAPAHAEETKPSKSVTCVGGNSCKGKSACATATTGCSGQNSCKGKGWITTKTEAECTKAGGHVATDKDKVGM